MYLAFARGGEEARHLSEADDRHEEQDRERHEPEGLADGEVLARAMRGAREVAGNRDSAAGDVRGADQPSSTLGSAGKCVEVLGLEAVGIGPHRPTDERLGLG
ncbi:MAG: hypothetical protein IPJ61_17345 [Tessaracoccus sp.]|uniref:hypothetical protein n=1 Tax=Tessaracoccus sp. TaxID=1971211 RepID=UPI001EC234EE|nr:hypothetical protein [Tessaracoccus sp.]MBK7822776.1 hypothetical protein [Tessaracoccus sp.]